MRRLKDFGRSGGGNDIHDSIGYNFKFTEIQACIGIEQMKKLPERVKRKKEIWLRYKSGLEKIAQIMLYESDIKNNSPWFIDVIVKDREALIEYLKLKGIGTRVMYPPINKQIAYKENKELVRSEFVGKNGLWLPSAVQLSNDQIDYICQSIRDFY